MDVREPLGDATSVVECLAVDRSSGQEDSVTHARARLRPGGHKKRGLLSPPLGKRSFIRVDMLLLDSPVVGQLTNADFRAWLALLGYVARWRGECDQRNGEFPRRWHRFAKYAKPGAQGRVSKRQVARFVELGLLEESVDVDGKERLRVRDWRDLRPPDWTGAQRQERWRDSRGYVGRRRIGSPASNPTGTDRVSEREREHGREAELRALGGSEE